MNIKEHSDLSISSRNARYAIFSKVRENLLKEIYQVNLPFMQTQQIRANNPYSLTRNLGQRNLLPSIFGRNAPLMKAGRFIRSKLTGPKTVEDVFAKMNAPATKLQKIGRNISAGVMPTLGVLRNIGLKAAVTPGIGIQTARGNVPSLKISGRDVIRNIGTLRKVVNQQQANVSARKPSIDTVVKPVNTSIAFSDSRKAQLMAKAAQDAEAELSKYTDPKTGKLIDISRLPRDEQRQAAAKYMTAKNLKTQLSGELRSSTNPYLSNYLVKNPIKNILQARNLPANISYPT